MSNSNNLKSEIKNIFFGVFPNLKEEEFDWEKHQSGYDDWYSFAQMKLITATESKFKIKFDIDDVIAITCANDLLKFIESHS